MKTLLTRFAATPLAMIALSIPTLFGSCVVKGVVIETSLGARLVMEDPAIIMLQGKERDAITAHFIYASKVGLMKIPFFHRPPLFQWTNGLLSIA